METDKQKMLKEFEDACKPVIDFMYKYGHPHMTVIITQVAAEMSEGQIAVPFVPRD